ncbi:MAG: TRAP transporter permease [Desulfarculus sp.]|nr:TRAP transporter permease [Pseudomonadota bacterium]MBV1715773.1 TRAP transporter permease [Desulfarculus sp.]MBU4574991.1 TRAP transporter permease [Pseudomonadota bacterium]MBU4597310.1 TRAP transporter permease [Pseudomonadota bacterium]MBV1739128.1 TRAP transporter permease [Desulfarculus sp.]
MPSNSSKSLTAWIITVVALGMSAFQLYTAQFGLFSAMVQRPVHLLFAAALVLLIFPVARSMSGGSYPLYLRIWDWVLITASAASLLHIVATYKDLVSRGGAATETDLWLGGLVILLVLETTRRVMGPSLPIITIVAIGYTLFGHHIPGMWGHRLIDLEQLIGYQYLTTEGLFTIPLGVSASFIFIFILFGAFLVASGTGEFFIKFANALAGHLRGGPAKVAVLSSATFGSISGSAVANVVSTGSFTIPLMKKIGYRPVFAGAIESVASTGGQFMPPVMGAAAFIIADMLGVTYLDVCKAALIPAVLYFFALIYMVHLEARRRDLRGLDRSELPNLFKTIKEGGHLLLPAVLLVILLVQGYSPMKAGLWALVAVVVISWFKKETRMGPKAILQAMEKGAKGSLEVALACACAGIVIGCVTQSGLGLKFSSLVIQASGGSLILSLVFVMIASLVLGMGLTTSAAYILTIILAGPVLVDLGVAPLAAHMFVFYYACLSCITPPVALAAFAAAGLAGSKPFSTGFESMRLAIIAYIVPFIFVYHPVLIWQGSWWAIALSFISATLGCMAIGSALMGFMNYRLNLLLRLALLAAAFGLIMPGIQSDLLGGALLGLVYTFTRFQARKMGPDTALAA